MRQKVVAAEAREELLQSPHLKLYFSKLGEDVALSFVFSRTWNGFYVDLGCNHSVRNSNTYLLYRAKGWRGINIDADPDIVARFRRARPGDTCVHAAVSDEVREIEFTIFDAKAHNTFDPAKLHQKRDVAVDRRISLTTRRLADILEEHVPPGQQLDLLNVDIEGADLAALRSNDWQRFPFGAICVEDHDLATGRRWDSEIYRFLSEQGYRLHSHIVKSSIYVRR